NDTVINAPTLESALRDSAMISGQFTQREVQKLAADLRAGSMTYTPKILSERNISPELGRADRVRGITATVVALLLVIGAMVAYYRFAGIIASVAVIFNLLILWATLQNLEATLTLAGIAGIILTVGMAVDANVLVFERIKEELSLTGRISSSIAAGYKRAFSAILDSNITTILAGIILLGFDAGPIKSFAINLIIGIASSMFTALFMTRVYFAHWLKNNANAKLHMSRWFQGVRFPFLRWTKVAASVSIILITLGSSLLWTHRSSAIGMDFTGGYALEVSVQGTADQVETSLKKAGVESRDFQVKGLAPSDRVRILLSKNLDAPGNAFAHIPELSAQSVNPRLAWVFDALTTEGLEPSAESWTSMSGQMSDAMRNNALLGLLIAFVSIYIYLAFRFEFAFAASALICLIHDVAITLGVIGVLNTLGIDVQIDLNTIAALMTIIGYSLNDTIIIFDRVREEMALQPHAPLPSIVNQALNTTLSRTTITSGTTLLVLIALVVLGGPSIFSFALVMTIGVFFGTLSSWFIASPLVIALQTQVHRKEKAAASG
ncbi:MAG: putative bifunctional preprotein translocase subunit SecD/SecF, partial [Chlamydiota bacterium]